MANLISGKLPPAEGMTEEAFYDYALYLSLREFLRVTQGLDGVKQLDESYSEGRRINQEAILRHPIGIAVAEMGRAFHEGAVLPGWDSEGGTMDWGKYSSFVRWYASLRPMQRSIVLTRLREGSETPWAPLAAAAEPQAAVEQNLGPRFPGGNEGVGTELATASGTVGLAKVEQETSLGTFGWVAILAIIASAGALIYRVLATKKSTEKVPT